MADAGRRCEPFAHGLDGLRGQVARPGAGALGALLDGLGAMGLGVYVVGADYAVQYQNGVLAARFPDAVGLRCYQAYCGGREPCKHCHVPAAMASGQPERTEFVGTNGHSYEALSVPLTAAGGGVLQVMADVTERPQAEAALRAGEEKHRQLLEGLQEAVYRMTVPEGRYEYMSPAARSVFGYDAEEFMRRPLFIREILHPEFQAYFQERWEDLLRGEVPPTYEYKTIGPGGRERWILQSNAAVLADDGRLVAIEGIMVDLTGQRQAEQALRRSERQFREFAERLPQVACETDADGRVTFANKEAFRAFGYTDEDLRAGLNVMDTIASVDRARAAQNVRRAMRGESMGPNEYLMSRRDGTTFPALVYSSPTVRDGEVVGMRCIVVDITDRKAAEADLRFQSTILAEMRDLVVATDLEGRITFVNDMVCESLQTPREALIGQSVAVLGEAPDRGATQRQIIERTRADGAWQGVVVNRAANGTDVVLECRTQLMRNEAGEPISMVGISADVTERMNVQEALRESEERYRSTVEALGDAIHVVDRDLRVLLSNRTFDQWRQRLGLPSQAVGRPLSEVCAFLGSQAADEYRQVFRTGQMLVTEESTRLGDREVVTETRKIPIAAEGEVTGVVTVVRDITESRRSTEALRESEARFRSLFEAAPLGYQSLDAEGRIAHVNRAWLETLGYERAEQVERRWFGDFLALEDASHFAGAYALFAEAGALRNVEWDMLRQDGTPIVALLNGRAVYNAEGRFQHMHCTMQDITARKRAELTLVRRAELLSRQIQERYDMVGDSPPMRALYEFIHKAAPTEAGVLICGESGVGKEMVARAIHDNSHRRDGPLEIVNCGAIPAALLESELFGHVRGAFTGAVADKPGRFELADGGTLFLDEITAMPLECQSKLLRAIEEGKIRRIGATRDHVVSVRLMAATNREPLEAVASGVLREDLFYRLDRLRVVVPPLRERGDDIQLLAQHFLGLCSASLRGTAGSFAPEVHEAFRAYRWPGNVRELRNVVERMVILADGPDLGIGLVPDDLRQASARAAQPEVEPLDVLERQQILRALKEAGGNKSRAARMLGIDRSTLYAKLRHYAARP